ncbi:MAG: stage V sporulation protein AB [Lachnospiraceae bacterium]|nr:stage V sporulation protein AB [Lachnospiraceae bacterium]
MAIFLEQCVCMILGFSSGLAVAGGVFAFISILGVLPRLCSRFRLADHVHQVETCVALGGMFGAVTTVFPFSLPFGQAGLGIFGIFSGIFVGALAMALAETLRVIPILSQRLKLKSGLPYVILCMALGKTAGCLMQFFFV